MRRLFFKKNRTDMNMIQIVLLGLVASAFFSATFILNRAMSLSGGHWVWASSLRFVHMFFLLIILLVITKGTNHLVETVSVFVQNIKFWLLAGGIGFGIFYIKVYSFPFSFSSAFYSSNFMKKKVSLSADIFYLV